MKQQAWFGASFPGVISVDHMVCEVPHTADIHPSIFSKGARGWLYALAWDLFMDDQSKTWSQGDAAPGLVV